MEKRRRFFAIGIFMLVFLSFPSSSYAAEEGIEGRRDEERADMVMEEVLGELEFDEVERTIEEIFPEGKVTFGEVVDELWDGNTKGAVNLIGEMARDRLLYEIDVNREGIIRILLIAITAAVLTNFSGLVKNRHISDISFYMLYLLLITICMGSFEVALDVAEKNLGFLAEFVKVLAPVYFLAVAFASGITTSAMFYHIVLVLIYIVELAVIRFLLPMIHVYIMVMVLDHLTEEDYFSKFEELLEIVIRWTLKILLTGVIGLNVVQGLLGPAIDSVGRNAIVKGVEMIPGIGDVAGGIGETVLGTVVLIKNGIGAGALIVCVLICIVPIVQMAVMTLMYKVAAAMIQPVSDNRIVECISGIGDGCQMLLRVIVNSAVLFLITIAIVAVTTS